MARSQPRRKLILHIMNHLRRYGPVCTESLPYPNSMTGVRISFESFSGVLTAFPAIGCPYNSRLDISLFLRLYLDLCLISRPTLGRGGSVTMADNWQPMTTYGKDSRWIVTLDLSYCRITGYIDKSDRLASILIRSNRLRQPR